MLDRGIPRHSLQFKLEIGDEHPFLDDSMIVPLLFSIFFFWSIFQYHAMLNYHDDKPQHQLGLGILQAQMAVRRLLLGVLLGCNQCFE